MSMQDSSDYWYDQSKALEQELIDAEHKIAQLRKQLEYETRRANDWQEEAERRQEEAERKLDARRAVIDDLLKLISEAD